MVEHPRTIVMGIGNPILGDDGIGILAVRQLRERFLERAGFRWLHFDEGALGGLELLDVVVGYERLMIVDAIQTEGGIPGEIYRMDLDDLRETLHVSNPHNMDLTTALKLGERYYEEKVPSDVSFFAMEVISVLEFTEELTEPVARALPLLVEMVEGYLVKMDQE